MTEPGELSRSGEIDYAQRAAVIMDAARATFDADIPSLAADFECFDVDGHITTEYVERTLEFQRTTAVAISSALSKGIHGSLLEPNVMEEHKNAIFTARVFTALSNQTAKELAPEVFDKPPGQSVIDTLHAQGRDPFEVMMRWRAAADVMLLRSSAILSATMAQMHGVFTHRDRELIAQHNALGPDCPIDELPGVHQAVELMQVRPQIRAQLPEDSGATFIEVYETWQDTQRYYYQQDAVSPALTALNRPRLERLEAQIVEEQAEQTAEDEQARRAIEAMLERFSGLIEDHTTRSAPFRTTWSQAQKAKLRDINTGLLALDRVGKIQLDIKDQAGMSKRLTTVLRALELFGQRERSGRVTAVGMVEKFATQLTMERDVETQIKTAQEAFAQVNIQPNLSKWLPVEPDLDFVQQHWAYIAPLIESKWGDKPDLRGQALADVTSALRHYNQAKKELDNPAERLKYIARALGAVALPPEARPQGGDSERERKRQVAQKTLKEIIKNPAHPEDARMRAEVIDRIMDVATTQRTPADDPDFGDLFWSDPAEDGTQYFCVTFRDEAGKEWTLFESLMLERASYVVPMDLVRQYGTLAAFVSDFGKADQRALGSKRVVHASGWTPTSHIARMYDKMRAATSE